MTPVYSASNSAVLRRSGTPLRFWYAAEGLIALLALLIFWPLLLTVAVILYVLSGQGPLITHERVGRYGMPFQMLKFRTMWSAGEPACSFFRIETVRGKVPTSKAQGDERVSSRFAAFCRRYSIDELPQLFHVACGEMSLVGPRPLTAAEHIEHYRDVSQEVLQLRPGLSGLWQVMGRNQLTYAQRRRLDLLLARRASSALYLRILIQSIPRVLAGSGAR